MSTEIHQLDILSKEQAHVIAIDILCNFLYRNVLQESLREMDSYDTGPESFEITHFLSSSPAIHLWRNLTPRIKAVTKKQNLIESSLFARIYRNNSFLGKHIDRDELNWTLTIPLFSSIINPWPIYVEDDQKNVLSFDNEIGKGVLFNATKFYHWRDKLICKSNEYSLHLFLHWKEI